MKNLILPFVVVALFAIGSCGDEAVQPSVNNPSDTTKKQDTTENNDTGSARIVKVNGLDKFNSEFAILVKNEKGVTNTKTVGATSQNQKTTSDYLNDRFSFRWGDNPENATSISFTLDQENRIIKDFKAWKGFSYQDAQNYISFAADSIPYTITGNILYAKIASPKMLKMFSYSNFYRNRVGHDQYTDVRYESFLRLDYAFAEVILKVE